MSDRNFSRRRRGMRFRPPKGLGPPSAVGIWNLALEQIFQKIGTEDFYRFFSRFTPLDYADGTLTLSEASSYQPHERQQETLEVIQRTLHGVTGRKLKVIFLPDELTPLESGPNPCFLEIGKVNAQLMSYLNQHPDYLHHLPPRKFEEVIAEVLNDLGCEVEITPQTRDGGRDILAAFPSPVGTFLVIVECKRYALHRKIGIDLVQRFLWVIDREDNASCGLLAATTHFSHEAKALAQKFKYRLKLHDFESVKQWISSYGKWTEKTGSGLWLPRSSGH